MSRRGSFLPHTLLLAFALLQGAALRGATVTRGPYLQSLLADTVVIAWSTDVPSAGKVRWTGPDGTAREAGDAPPGTGHRVALVGLAPGAAYRYVVLDGSAAITQEAAFRTSPPPGDGTVKVAVAGDTGSGDANQAAVAAVIEGMHPDLFLQTGDIDYINDADRALFGPYRKLLASTCFYPCMGNDRDPTRDWAALFALPFDGPRGRNEIHYSFDWGSAHFAALDTELGFADGSPQRTWIEADLAAARARRIPWIILWFHRPPYTVGRYGTGTFLARTLAIREAVGPLAERFGVDLILNGHDHNYQRSWPVRGGTVVGKGQEPRYVSPGGTIHLVTGGGGRTLYSETTGSDHTENRLFAKAFHAVELTISLSRIDARAIASDGAVIDTFSIEKGFIRGDADVDGDLDLTDIISLLGYLFQAATEPPCLDRLDANDDGATDISDAIYLLFPLFAGGAPPPAPFPEAGPDPTPDGLPCS